jgi:NAD(P)-dependent dehydrogenase (short-subunit alcohol dehydrogenase family)
LIGARERATTPRMDMNNSSMVVTGGASGLGRATVDAFVQRGAFCVIADRDEARGKEAEAAHKDRVAFVKTDVTDATSVQAAIDTATKRAPLRVVVQCAGVGTVARTVDKEGHAHDLELFKKTIDINLVGHFNVMRLAAAAMMKNAPDGDGQRGLVVMTASVAAFEGQIGQVAYSASKGGVVAMTLPAARDLSKPAIRVMTIAPGTFDTPMLAMLPEDAKKALGAAIPNPARLGQPLEFARLVIAICDNPYLNGETIRLDGALRLAPK